MPELTDFFQGSNTQLGVFYPNHHLIAVFSDPSIAAHAASRLRIAGFAESDVIATDGNALMELEKSDTRLGSLIMQAASRFFSTEQLFTDNDLEHAREGRGFLAVRCPDDEIKALAWKVIQAESPIDARYYSSAGIEHLAGDIKTD